MNDSYINNIKKLAGLPPYNSDTNISKGDGYFRESIKNKYNKTNEEIDKDIKSLREGMGFV